MKQEGLLSQTGYHRRSGHYSGCPAVVVPNHLQRQFTVDGLNKVWVTDITYICRQDFLKAHRLVPSMSRRDNFHDNAVAKSFFQLLKQECIKRKTYNDREEARRDIFDYIEMFYNPKRRHGSANGLSPVEYEKQYFQQLWSVSRSRGDSEYLVAPNTGKRFRIAAQI